jgi:hypothetical protein
MLVSLTKWLWRKIMNKMGIYPIEMLERRRALSRALLKRLEISVSAVGAKLIVLLIPHPAYPKDGLYGDWVLNKTKMDCISLEIWCIDFIMKPDMYGSNGHWSMAGNAMAARRINKFLKKTGVVSQGVR